jgi:hypothetical protein
MRIRLLSAQPSLTQINFYLKIGVVLGIPDINKKFMSQLRRLICSPVHSLNHSETLRPFHKPRSGAPTAPTKFVLVVDH